MGRNACSIKALCNDLSASGMLQVRSPAVCAARYQVKSKDIRYQASTTTRLSGSSLPPSSPFFVAQPTLRQSAADMQAFFSRSGLCWHPDPRSPDERTLKLGQTIRILHDRLPTLLQSQLPQDILSPSITLRLFPSTHPHLPIVSGRLAYVAALWTSPVAWGRIPVIGNVRLVILNERMVKNGGHRGERLVVKWRTAEEDTGKSAIHSLLSLTNLQAAIRLNDPLSSPVANVRSTTAADPTKHFTGLFIFEFDDKGRIASHIIEHAEEGSDWEKTTSKVISVTDWLLGRAWKKQEEPELALHHVRQR